uniref:Spermatogenesis associated 2 like n=1 Tax=Cynoglossus semilaevis TaxID=244447 RepID=A0A3P8X4T9_CYNSE
MNSGTQRARDLLTAYDLSLEQQILGRGSSLACRDQELWKRVEGLLRDRDPQEIHCLGLDPLTVMEESLKMAVTTAASRGRAKTRGGLQGLAKAFEVLEQAALNLYLGPWREEYKVVKTYSGLFTHHIKAVLPPPQIEQLFGLLGYRSSPSQQEQVLSVAPSSPDDFLRLSCAFFLARCECRLLEEALGKHRGEAQWELKMVRERQRGHGSGRLQDGAVSEAVDSLCSCVQSPHLSLRRCVQCRTVHNDGCAMLKLCEENQHLLEGGSSMVSLQREDGGADGSRTSPALSSSSSQMSSLVLHDPQSSIPSFLCPITFHDCCNLGHLDPKVLCRSCNVFHSTSCRGQQMCLELDHSVQPLGVCVCGRTCSRNPLVLCRYCGSELCNECWYHSPVVCRVCHLTYDQSSPV